MILLNHKSKFLRDLANFEIHEINKSKQVCLFPMCSIVSMVYGD